MPSYFSLIPDNDQKRFLLLEAENGWTLPATEHDGFYDDAKGWFHLHLQHDLRRQLGLHATTLKHIHETVYEMELHGLPRRFPPEPYGSIKTVSAG